MFANEHEAIKYEIKGSNFLHLEKQFQFHKFYCFILNVFRHPEQCTISPQDQRGDWGCPWSPWTEQVLATPSLSCLLQHCPITWWSSSNTSYPRGASLYHSHIHYDTTRYKTVHKNATIEHCPRQDMIMYQKPKGSKIEF